MKDKFGRSGSECLKEAYNVGPFNMVKPNRTEPNRIEIDNMVWFWYIPYKPNGYNFIKTVGFGYEKYITD